MKLSVRGMFGQRTTKTAVAAAVCLKQDRNVVKMEMHNYTKFLAFHLTWFMGAIFSLLYQFSGKC